jgi:hypothetical protein
VRRALVAGVLTGTLAGCNITGTDDTQERADSFEDCVKRAGFTIDDVGVTHRGLDADDRYYNVVTAERGGSTVQAYAFESASIARESYDEVTFSRDLQPEDPLVGPFVLNFEPGAASADIAAARRCAQEAG